MVQTRVTTEEGLDSKEVCLEQVRVKGQSNVVTKVQTLELDFLGSYSISPPYMLCDVGLVIAPLCASVSSSIK